MTLTPRYIEIPITNQFNLSKIIGSLRIDANQLPKHPNYIFAIGGNVIQGGFEKSTTLGREVYTIHEFELTHVALIPEDQLDWQQAEDVWVSQPKKKQVTSKKKTTQPPIPGSGKGIIQGGK